MANAEHFIRFVKVYKDYKMAKKFAPSLTIDKYAKEIEKHKNFDMKDSVDHFIEHVDTLTNNAKIFEIDDDQKKLLLLSDPPENNDDVKLSFKHIFLDVKFTNEELKDLGINIPENIREIIGMGVSEGTLHDLSTFDIAGDTIRFSILVIDDKGFEFNTFADFYTIREGYENSTAIQDVTPKPVKKFIHKFFLSFINFINNPEVEFVEHIRSQKNVERRLKKGLPVIPSTTNIRITGKLRIYIDELSQSEGWYYGYRFWVRGHFRVLSAERYAKPKRIFIPPYIKGKGILVDKAYSVEKKE